MTKPNPPWQPWSTAPKDGTILIGWHQDHSDSTIRFRWNADFVTWTCNGKALLMLPMLWRPMPPGPYDEPENAELLEACKAAYRKISGDCTDGVLPMDDAELITLLRDVIANPGGTDA